MIRTGRRSQRTRAVRICRRSGSRLARRVRIRTRSSCTGRQCARCSSWSMPFPSSRYGAQRRVRRSCFCFVFTIITPPSGRRAVRPAWTRLQPLPPGETRWAQPDATVVSRLTRRHYCLSVSRLAVLLLFLMCLTSAAPASAIRRLRNRSPWTLELPASAAVERRTEEGRMQDET